MLVMLLDPTNWTRPCLIAGNALVYPLIALSLWAERLGARTLKLVEGKWLLRVELGVDHSIAPFIAYLGRYRLTGAAAPSSSVVDFSSRRIKKWRASAQRVSGTQEHCARLLKGFSNNQGPLCKVDTPSVHGRAFACLGPTRIRLSPSLLMLFLFLFLPDLENP